MKVIAKDRGRGKTQNVIELAEQYFAYIVCPTQQDVERVWRRAMDGGYDIPQPITWDDFMQHRYHRGGVKSFVIDDLDRCVQFMTNIEIRGVSLNYEGNP